jgi:hypothetical protein
MKLTDLREGVSCAPHTRLRFTNWRCLDRARAKDSPSASYVEAIRLTRGIPPASERKGVRPTMCRAEDLGPLERERFVACARIFGAVADEEALAFEDLFTERLAKVDRTGKSFSEDFEAATIEWWDVVDDDDRERVLYGLLFMGPGYGKLMKAESTESIGYVNQYDLYPQEEPNPYLELWSVLAVAQKEAKALYPDSELAEMAVPLR